MFDEVDCQYPLPDGFVPKGGAVAQTKDTDAQSLDLYEIRADGTIWQEVYDIEDLSPEEFQVLVRQFEMIWMSGGIASYLLNAVKKVKLDTLLSSLLNEGIVYVGSSSGAMIMNPTLKVAEWYIGEPDQKSKGIAG